MGIELAFREIKYGLNLVLLHGKSDEYAAQEIYAAMIMYNFCSRIASQVVLENRENLIHEYAVNMEMAHMFCKDFLRGNIESGDELMYLISKFVEPIRPDRSDKRKIRPQGFRGFVYCVPA